MKERALNLARRFICKADYMTNELYDITANIEDAVDMLDDPENTHRGLIRLGKAVQDMHVLLSETGTSPDIARAARKYELEQWLKENKDLDLEDMNLEI